MFNGIIYNQGKVKKIKENKKGKSIFLYSKLKINKKNIGMSLACDGVCLTLVSAKKNILEFYLLHETINRSKFKYVKAGDIINLELPLKYGQDISGHICQGHVDTTSEVIDITKKGASKILEFGVNKKYKNLLIEKASILINGVSLTISKKTKRGFEIWLIPHTLKLTNLKKLKKNDLVNVELDIFGKYIYKYSS